MLCGTDLRPPLQAIQVWQSISLIDLRKIVNVHIQLE